MPIYEYQCRECSHRFAVLQKIGEGSEHLQCEQCGTAHPVKQFSAFASIGGEHHASGASGMSSGRRFT